jgi:hypothetical protein
MGVALKCLEKKGNSQRLEFSSNKGSFKSRFRLIGANFIMLSG